MDWIVAMQATSPISGPQDIEQALQRVQEEKLNSLFATTEVEDFNIWAIDIEGSKSINYNYKKLKRYQDTEKRYLENRTFYIFSPQLLRRKNSRLIGNIGIHLMEHYKMFQIDTEEDFLFCQSIRFDPSTRPWCDDRPSSRY